MTPDRIVSRSEAGQYFQYGDADMKVLRASAERAKRFFENDRGGPGLVFSVIEDGRLTDNVKAVDPRRNAIYRALCSEGAGGRKYLSYADTAPDGGVWDAVLVSDVKDVSIRDGILSISGLNRSGLTVNYAYRIQDEPDSETNWKTMAVTPTKTSGKSVSYDVMVNGSVEGTFSSKSKAEAYKRELKAKGLPAYVYGVIG